jgi:hypothetical protein
LKIPELPSIKCVSERILWDLWKKISDKPLPEVYAYTLNNKDFDYLLNLLQKNPGVKDTRVRAYVIDFDNRFIEACSFKMNEDYFVVLIKQSAPLQESKSKKELHEHMKKAHFG